MNKYFYLIHIQYLGFRYHGWKHQPGLKTVESMVEKTLQYVLGRKKFKILGTSRTDAMVSAGHFVFELFLQEKLEQELFFNDFNQNLPADIRALKVEETCEGFNIIQAPCEKEYIYLFSHGEKAHPFCAPLLTSFSDTLDIDLMKEGAMLYEGEHDFFQYCTKPSPETKTVRNVSHSRIEANAIYSASFFPEKTYLFHVRSKGFMRNQVRLMMGQLIRLGKGKISLKQLEESLKGKDHSPLEYIAPASGLILNQIIFPGQQDKPSPPERGGDGYRNN